MAASMLASGDALADPLRRVRCPSRWQTYVGIQAGLARVITHGHPLAADAAQDQSLQQGRTFAGGTRGDDRGHGPGRSPAGVAGCAGIVPR